MTKERIKIGEFPYSAYSSMITGEMSKSFFDAWKHGGISANTREIMDKVCDMAGDRFVYKHLTERVDKPEEKKVEDYLVVYYNNNLA